MEPVSYIEKKQKKIFQNSFSILKQSLNVEINKNMDKKFTIRFKVKVLIRSKGLKHKTLLAFIQS